jgi:methylated-DNA-[protein]-cysteine S-methyltransferase
MRLEQGTVSTPIGQMTFVVHKERLIVLDFEGGKHDLEARLRRRFPEAQLVPAAERHPVAERLRAYFAGKLDALDGLAVDAQGTEFQKRVWAELRRIPVGRTMSYRELAERVGRPKSMRAVGAANASNPIALVVPCHRVIRADGELCGYAAGLERKRWLLEHEGAWAGQRQRELF